MYRRRLRSSIATVARGVLGLLPDQTKLPILSGPLQGTAWIPHSSRLQCFLGSYEPAVTERIETELSPGDIFFDVGAHVGYHTLTGSRRCGTEGAVISFEPFARNIRYLQAHVEANDLQNVTIRDVALSAQAGESLTFGAEDPWTARVDPEGSEQVATSTIDEEVRRLRPPSLIKIDVEGEEEAVLEGAHDCLEVHGPALIIEAHGHENREIVQELLRDYDYRFEAIADSLSRATLFAEPRRAENRRSDG